MYRAVITAWKKKGKKPTNFKKYLGHCSISDHNKLWEILQEMGIPDHLTCLLRNLYAGQEEQLDLDMEQQIDSKVGKK